MGILQQLIDFFKSLFAQEKSDMPQRQQLRKLETQLRQMNPPLYKSGELLPAFGELIFLLYTHTTPLFKLLSFMRASENARIKNRIYDMLIETGYMQNDRQKLASYSEKNRGDILSDIAQIKSIVDSWSGSA